MQELTSTEFFTYPGFPCPPGMRVKTLEIRPGMEISLVSCYAAQVLSAVTEGEGRSARIHFNCQLSGQTRVSCQNQNLELARGRTLTSFIPDARFHLQCSADWQNIELRVHPPLLAELAGSEYGDLRDYRRAEDGLLCQACSQRIMDSAERLSHLMMKDPPSVLLVHSTALEFLAWHLAAAQSALTRDEIICPRERRRLWEARELLLSDLSKPPTIEQLARETGLNQLKIKRGFKQLFGISTYALFQRKRMEHAHSLLQHHSVTETATMMGYSNLSHFSAAFRKQFGVLPKDARRFCR
ncbi:helix-turn-helix domain-containing protein [Affinibrenneria salicis]|uniref:Helix-turn-helix domain-containing protein n=1 Tax=Affinibrenneria salicis TaxID=2590031 RepID=A0A5J5FUH2_9GAMM|nr:AraC family transcriptional regulator [Affinibrenneria salicis]KAA8996656.1 helix-turn-helix domain-containing protein [Affinibrenneria salicis]